jgi:cell division protein FtsQ
VQSLANKVVSIEDRIPKLKEQRKKKANRRIVTLLLLFLMLIISILYFQSPYSKIGEIHVTGNQLTTTKEIIETSNLTDKTVLFNLNKKDIAERILTLPAIEKVEISIRFPNRVNVHITEHEMIGYMHENGSTYPFLENGIVVKTDTNDVPEIGPVLQDFSDAKIQSMLAEQLKQMPEEIRNSISEIIYTPKKTDEYSINAFMNDGNEVRATLRTFAEKMKYYPTFVKQLHPEDKGIIDIEVGAFFKSFQSEITDQNAEKNQNDASDLQ